MAFHIVPLGAEVPSNRKLIAASDFTRAGLTYANLVKRGLPKTKPYLLEGRFEDHLEVWLEPGLGLGELAERFLDQYLVFVNQNLDRLHTVVEVDLGRGLDWLEQHRAGVWTNVPEEKFVPVWHFDHGLPALESLAQRYPRVGIPDATIQIETTLASKVVLLQKAYGTRFHAIGCATPDNLRSIKFESASTLAWLSPMRRGETVVWTGTKLVRYPKSQKEQARRRHFGLWRNAGFDAEKIAADDPNTVAMATLHAYKELEQSVDKRRPPVGNNPFTVLQGGKDDDDWVDDRPPLKPYDEDMVDALEDALVSAKSRHPAGRSIAESDPDDAGNRAPVMRNVPKPRPAGDRAVLPVFGVEYKDVTEQTEHGPVLKQVGLPVGSGATVRACDTCFVAANCPAFTPGSACAFNMPVEVKTKEQVRALLAAVIEMQGTRVAFARFAEELNGGYPDPTVSDEIDRLFKMVKSQKELDENREYLKVTMERSSNAGVLSAIFGGGAASQQALPGGGLDADQTNRLIVQEIEDV